MKNEPNYTTKAPLNKEQSEWLTRRLIEFFSNKKFTEYYYIPIQQVAPSKHIIGI